MDNVVFQKREAAFLPFKKLWPTDENWITARKAQWVKLKEALNLDAEQETFSQYFIYGEAKATTKDGILVSSSGIYGCARLVMTPYSSAAEAAALYAGLENRQKLEVLTAFCRTGRDITCLPDHRDKMRWFIEGVYFPEIVNSDFNDKELNAIFAWGALEFMMDARARIYEPETDNDIYILYATNCFNEILKKLVDPISVIYFIQDKLDELIKTTIAYKNRPMQGEQAFLVETLLALFSSAQAAPWLKERLFMAMPNYLSE